MYLLLANVSLTGAAEPISHRTIFTIGESLPGDRANFVPIGSQKSSSSEIVVSSTPQIPSEDPGLYKYDAASTGNGQLLSEERRHTSTGASKRKGKCGDTTKNRIKVSLPKPLESCYYCYAIRNSVIGISPVTTDPMFARV